MTDTTTREPNAGNLSEVESLCALSRIRFWQRDLKALPTTFVQQETFMKWQTPAASDFRFGFEITMYIANR